jgi:glycosyltransferase involved in cell wall biosynthesis
LSTKVKLNTYFVIVTCRNSESNISESLFSLRDQTVKPEYIIVVNDGSTDRTQEILEDIQKNSIGDLHLIQHPDWGYDVNRTVKNWNEAIKLTKDKNFQKTEYHLIATDDTIYSNDYAQKVIAYMDSNLQTAVVSGNYSRHKPTMPHGAGRFVRNSFFENTSWHGYYPEQMGFESAILYEANSCGFSTYVLNEARFEHIRPLGRVHKFREFGASMRTLGYHPLFAIARFLKYFVTGTVTGRIGSLYMLYYYITYKPKSRGYHSIYSEKIRHHVRRKQINKLKDILSLHRLE